MAENSIVLFAAVELGLQLHLRKKGVNLWRETKLLFMPPGIP
jgi:hypothetical protein